MASDDMASEDTASEDTAREDASAAAAGATSPQRADQHGAPGVIGRAVSGPHGEQIGVVSRVYRDDATGYPEWIAVRTSRHERVVPVGPVQLDAEPVAIAFDADAVAAAPEVATGDHLSVADHRLLVRHYGLDRTNEAEPRAFDREGEPGAGHLPSERLEHGSSAD